MAKHALASDDSTSTKRVKPTPIQKRPFRITNLDDGEVVHQTCIVVHGECQAFDYAEETNFVSVTSADMLNRTQTVHHWPLNEGQWRALMMLAPGANKLVIKLHHAGAISDSRQITVTYFPLLQLPPLHLAVLVAKDSPLLIDCPPAKYGAISTAHSSIDAAIAKFRMSAYMWQALTAEDFRQKGLGRRSFRLEEEWTPNTTAQTAHQVSPDDNTSPMGAVAKVHIVRSEKTVAELRDADVAQQNPRGRDRDALHRYFEAALANAGAPFESRARPVVAGMVLDAHYSTEQTLILGHAALGCHKPSGISLGIFGSHLAYSWPRFMEEVPACLTDLMAPGDTVGNDNGECDAMRGACFVGQGAFLHEVGHAFGAGHTTGIMARGYSKSWGMNFVTHPTNNAVEENEAKWDMQDALKFKLQPHFALPGDEPVSKDFAHLNVSIAADFDRDDVAEMKCCKGAVNVSCAAGLAQVKIQSGESHPIIHDFMDVDQEKGPCTIFSVDTVGEKFDQTQPLKITALGLNGIQRVVADMWPILRENPYIFVPDSDVVLRKRSVRSAHLDGDDDAGNFVRWAMLLRHRGQDGQLHRATSIDLRVGCTMDGAVVYYADGQHANCGPAGEHHFGGHASESHDLSADETITKVRVCRDDDNWGSLGGIRMTLSNGEEWGYLNYGDSDSNIDSSDGEEDGHRHVVVLEPGDDEVIVGFYGQSDWGNGFTHEFGILTAPRGLELPESVYDLPELRN